MNNKRACQYLHNGTRRFFFRYVKSNFTIFTCTRKYYTLKILYILYYYIIYTYTYPRRWCLTNIIRNNKWLIMQWQNYTIVYKRRYLLYCLPTGFFFLLRQPVIKLLRFLQQFKKNVFLLKNYNIARHKEKEKTPK